MFQDVTKPKPCPLLSVALIVRDEESVLDRCLQSLYYHAPHKNTSELVPIWDELVVVDTGSTDSTITIAEKHGAHIGHFSWINDMSAARNYAESLCTGKWIYMQDADEVLIKGHQYMRAVVEGDTDKQGIQPLLIFSRDATGKPAQTLRRQPLFHRNDGKWYWEGAAHEDMVGPLKTTTDSIIVEHLGHLPGVNHKNNMDIAEALRQNLGTTFDERHLFYLAREHWYKGHYQEAIAIADMVLNLPPVWPIQRSGIAIIKGDCLKALGLNSEARAAYLQAVYEWGDWAEPYFSMGMLHYDCSQWSEGATWFYASLPFQPPDWFTDRTIYDWRRYDQLAVCLSNLGRNKEAVYYGRLALTVLPDDGRLLNNMKVYQAGLPTADIPLFSELNIETHSFCNRQCKTCLRQTYPDNAALSERVHINQLPDDVVYRLIDEAVELGFTGTLCLQHFNEPLFDDRITDFAKYAKNKGTFSEVYACTNGDPLNKKLAQKLDGTFDRLQIALYGGDTEKRKARYSSWFKKTQLIWADEHLVTHYSPYNNLQECIRVNRNMPCLFEARHRMIVSYTGEMMLCCEDIGCAWDLGNVNESSLKDLWFSSKHTEILKTLAAPGGRKQHPYCQECPRESR